MGGLIMNSMNFVKGVGVGLVLGSAVSMVVMPHNNKRNGKNMIGKALRTMGEVIESISDAVSS
jgi:gas vesicle protein